MFSISQSIKTKANLWLLEAGGERRWGVTASGDGVSAGRDVRVPD